MTTTDLVHSVSDTSSRVVESETGLRLRRPDVSLSVDEWAALGRRLAKSSNAWLWAIGDWFLMGEKTYGSTYTEAIAITGLNYQLLANCAYVASRVSSREEKLSFYHHFAVAPLPPYAQKPWLDKALQEGLSVQALRTAIRAEHELPAADPRLDVRFQLAAPPERAQRWKQAAERAGAEFSEWASTVLDEAAA